MKVVILCGGLGSRLSEETKKIPKPMVSIGNIPILIHIMNIYSKYGDIKSLKGKNLNEILPALENLGFKVELKGNGLVVKNYNIINKINLKKIYYKSIFIFTSISISIPHHFSI